jgi:hypothetical protein
MGVVPTLDTTRPPFDPTEVIVAAEDARVHNEYMHTPASANPNLIHIVRDTVDAVKPP